MNILIIHVQGYLCSFQFLPRLHAKLLDVRILHLHEEALDCLHLSISKSFDVI
jgi:hypothetical protein